MALPHALLLSALCVAAHASADTTFSGSVTYLSGVPLYNYDPNEEPSLLDVDGVPLENYNANKKSSQKKRDWVLIEKPGATDEQVHSLCTDAGRECVAEGHPSEGAIGFATIRASFEELKELAAKHNGELSFMEPSMPMHAMPTDENPNISTLQFNTDRWGLDRIDDETGLDETYEPKGDGKGVHVYVLDTGLRTTHSDFGGRAIATLEGFTGRAVPCRAGNTDCARDVHGHGTHCAGTVGGKESGVARAAVLHGVKVLGDSGSGSTAGIIASMDWIVQNAVRPAVMSMSLGGPGRSNAYKVGIDAAVKAGITVVVAAGNSRSDACRFTPAYVPAAITVGATNLSDYRAVFSNYGSCLDLYGPGKDIVSAGKDGDNAWKSMSGTSMACPHVAGAVALLLQRHPKMTPADIDKALKDAAFKNKVADAKPGSPNLLLGVISGKFAPEGRSGGGGDKKPPSPSPPDGGGGDSCEDIAANCKDWTNHCSLPYAKTHCKKTCEHCGGKAPSRRRRSGVSRRRKKSSRRRRRRKSKGSSRRRRRSS